LFRFFQLQRDATIGQYINAIVHWLTIIATITEHTRKAVQSKYLRYGLNIYNRRTIDGSKLGERDPTHQIFSSDLHRSQKWFEDLEIRGFPRKIGIPELYDNYYCKI
jgi:hypothetical protein